MGWLCILLISTTAVNYGEKPRANLVANGNFEKGTSPKGHARGPSSWQLPDGLTTFWVKTPGRKGRCMKIDTDVLCSQFRKREDEMAKALEEGREPTPPPKRLPTKEPKYDTVAGLDGVHFTSVDIPISPEKSYMLSVDVKASRKAKPKIWVKAYAKVTSRAGTRQRVVWKKSLNCETAEPEWKTFRMVFPANTQLPGNVEKVRLQLYPYWPPGTYYYDNVCLYEISKEEVKAFCEDQGLRVGNSGKSGGGKGTAPAKEKPSSRSRGR